MRTNGPADEAPQTPGFDEYVLVLKGKMVVDVGVGVRSSAFSRVCVWTVCTSVGRR